MIKTLFDFCFYSIFARFIFWITPVNRNWLEQFSEPEKSILDNWNGIRNLQIKFFVLYLSSRYLHFDEADFIVRLDYKDRICAILNLIFAGLFAFLGALLLFVSLRLEAADGQPILVGFGFVLLLSAIGLVISYTDKYAALYVQKLLSK